MAVAIVPELGDIGIEEWSEAVFREWGLGKKDRDNGVLIVISPGSRMARIETGYGTEGILTDALCRRIIGDVIAPRMNGGNLDGAVAGAVAAVGGAMTDPAAVAELRSGERDYQGGRKVLDVSVFYNFLMIVAALGFLYCCYVFFRDLFSARRRRASRYDRARMWRADRNKLLIGGIVSAGTGLVFFLLAWLIYRRLRTKPLKCPTCGHKMRRLPEDEDNQLLSDAQDLEERLRTVDYDVWECPQCGAVERFRYRYPQGKYTECPSCHTVAMCHVGDVVTRPATERREGEGGRVYECKYCHQQKRLPYVIPKKTDASAALVAGAILGSILYRFIIAIALRLDLPSECLKLISAVIVALAIGLPAIKSAVRPATKGGKV